MNAANKFQDLMTSFCFVTGIYSFVSGDYMLSTLLLASASVISNLDLSDQ
jgi:hypothetical protein